MAVRLIGCFFLVCARMENVENVENKTTFLKQKAFFSIVAQDRE